MSAPFPPFTCDDLKNWMYVDALTSQHHGYLFKVGGESHLVSADSLALLDTRLPWVASRLTEDIHWDRPLSASMALSATLRYWSKPAPIAVPAHEHETGVYALDAVHDVDAYLSEQDLFSIRYLRSDVITDDTLSFISNVTGNHVMHCSYAWCEQHFPGSVSRLKACFAMEMSSREIANLGFYTTASTTLAELPDMLL